MEIRIPPSLDELPLHRDKVEKVCRAAMEDPAIVGMAIGGSVVAGSPDVYSDVDLRLIVEDGAFDEIFNRRDALAAAGGRAIAAFTGEHVGFPELLITLYDDLVHVDFAFVRDSEWPNFSETIAPHAVLWERDNALSARMASREAPSPTDELAWLEGRMWTWVWYVHSKILRGELYEALDGIQYMRNRVLFSLLAMTRGMPHAGSRRAERIVGDLSKEFEATIPALDAESCARALQTAVALYLKLADPLLQEHDVKQETAAREVVLA